MRIHPEPSKRHVLSVVVDNEAGILARVAGLFTARGYNIESLAVGVSEDPAISGMTIVTSASSQVLEQIIAQLERLIPVHSVVNLTAQAGSVERELALLRFSGNARCILEATEIAVNQGARIIATAGSALVIELTGPSTAINSIIARLRAAGDVQAARTGVVAVAGITLNATTD